MVPNDYRGTHCVLVFVDTGERNPQFSRHFHPWTLYLTIGPIDKLKHKYKHTFNLWLCLSSIENFSMLLPRITKDMLNSIFHDDDMTEDINRLAWNSKLKCHLSTHKKKLFKKIFFQASKESGLQVDSFLYARSHGHKQEDGDTCLCKEKY